MLFVEALYVVEKAPISSIITTKTDFLTMNNYTRKFNLTVNYICRTGAPERQQKYIAYQIYSKVSDGNIWAGILNNLWELETEKEEDCRTGRPGYIGWRNWILRINSWTLKRWKIRALLIKNRFLDGSAGDLKEALLQAGQAEAACLPAGHEAMEQLTAHVQDSTRTLRRRQEVEQKGLEDVLFQEGGSPFLYHSLRIRYKLNNRQNSKQLSAL